MPVVAVAVLDRDSWLANTDVLAVVDPARRRIRWVPRDLWSRRLHDRINAAWARGGAPLLARVLADARLPVDGVVCLRRTAVSRVLDAVVCTVPVTEEMTYLYPVEPLARLEDGAVTVTFRPPAETLSGVRIHQWIGARTRPDGRGSDLQRIVRQQVLLRVLLELHAGGRFDFEAFAAEPDRVAGAGPAERATLATVDVSWTLDTLDGLVDRWIDGKAVLVPDPDASRGRVHRLVRRTRRATRRWVRSAGARLRR